MSDNNPLQIFKPATEFGLKPLSDAQYTLIGTDIVKRRDDLLAESSNIERVIGESSQETAATMLNRISKTMSAVENARKTVKEPFLDMGKKIDKVAKDFVAPLDTEKGRLARLISDFQMAKQREVEEARRKQEAELRRIEEEKRKLEAAALAGSVTEEQAQVKQQELVAQTSQQLVVHEVPKASGIAVKPTRKFRVIDLKKLYEAKPELVHMEPKTAEINKLIRAEGNENLTIPGLELYSEVEVRAR